MKGRAISLITEKDEKLFKTFRISGYLTEKHLKDIGVSAKRMDKFAKDGYAQKGVFQDKDKEYKVVYKLTNKGKSFCKSFFDLKNINKMRGVLPDVALADQYILLSEEERETWMTKSDILEMFHLDAKEVVPDAVYFSDGRMIAIQTRTVNSNKEKLQEKRDFCILHDIEYIEIRT